MVRFNEHVTKRSGMTRLIYIFGLNVDTVYRALCKSFILSINEYTELVIFCKYMSLCGNDRTLSEYEEFLHISVCCHNANEIGDVYSCYSFLMSITL